MKRGVHDSLAVRGESVAWHRDRRGASLFHPTAHSPRRGDPGGAARRPQSGAPTVRVVHGGVQYREYLREEQRSPRGCIARPMQPGFHHGLLGSMQNAQNPPSPAKMVGEPMSPVRSGPRTCRIAYLSAAFHKYGDAPRAARRPGSPTRLPRWGPRPRRKARGGRIPGVFDRRATPRGGMHRRPNATVFMKVST